MAMPPITGLAGFEPGVTESKSVALPLGYSPLIKLRAVEGNRTLEVSEPQSDALTTSPQPPWQGVGIEPTKGFGDLYSTVELCP